VALFWAQFPRGGEASRRPLGFGKGSDRGGLGISRAARRASRPLRCGLRLPVRVGADVANGRVWARRLLPGEDGARCKLERLHRRTGEFRGGGRLGEIVATVPGPRRRGLSRWLGAKQDLL
jgi:hypothetical protein